MNLEKLNVTELSSQEMKTTEGGWGILAAIVVAVVSVITDLVSDGKLDGNVNKGD